MQSKISLSVIVIYDSKRKNPYLEKLKKSVEAFAELILYDLHGETISNFSQTRNKALEQANHEYVLFLDSDEILAQQSVAQIEKIVSEGKIDLVSVKRTDIFLGKQVLYGEVAAIHLIRLGKKDKMHFIRTVHETVALKPEYVVSASPIQIYHYAHENIASFIQKVSYYALLEAQFRKKKKQPFSLFELFFFPLLKFLFNYLIRQGYRDGYRGLIYAFSMSLHSLFVRVHLYELSKN